MTPLFRPSYGRVLLCLLAGALTACGPGTDLSKAVAVTDIVSGYYDDGLLNGVNHLVPSITFRLRNQSAETLPSAQVSVSYWQEGADGEMDSSPQLRGIGSEGLAPGASTDPITIRVAHGYNLAQPRAELFQNREFKDVVARVFIRRSNRIFALGQYKLDRKILPHESGPPK
jgi:hypothetical protein